MAFKLPSLRGKVTQTNLRFVMACHYSNGRSCETKKTLSAADPLVWFLLRIKNSEKVVNKKLLSENDQEKRLFIKEAKMFHGVKSEHIVKFKAVCISNIINLFLGGEGGRDEIFRRSVAF